MLPTGDLTSSKRMSGNLQTLPDFAKSILSLMAVLDCHDKTRKINVDTCAARWPEGMLDLLQRHSAGPHSSSNNVYELFRLAYGQRVFKQSKPKT